MGVILQYKIFHTSQIYVERGEKHPLPPCIQDGYHQPPADRLVGQSSVVHYHLSTSNFIMSSRSIIESGIMYCSRQVCLFHKRGNHLEGDSNKFFFLRLPLYRVVSWLKNGHHFGVQMSAECSAADSLNGTHVGGQLQNQQSDMNSCSGWSNLASKMADFGWLFFPVRPPYI